MLVYQRVFGQGLEDGPPQHTIQTVPPGNRKRSSGKHVRSPWAWHAHGQPPARVEGAGSDRVLKARMEPPQKGTSTFQTSEMEFVLISCMLWQPQALAAPIIPTYIYTVYIYILYLQYSKTTVEHCRTSFNCLNSSSTLLTQQVFVIFFVPFYHHEQIRDQLGPSVYLPHKPR